MIRLRGYICVAAGLLSIFHLCGCSKKHPESQAVGRTEPPISTPATASTPASAAPVLTNAPLSESQVRLLESAFDTATAIPVKPHIKNRSKAQQAVVTAALELNQPGRAAGFSKAIENWRQGLAWADLAFYLAEQNKIEESNYFVQAAQGIIKRADEGDESLGFGLQEWRVDRIRVRIAQTLALLGQSQQAREMEAGVVESEQGRVVTTVSAGDDEVLFDEQIKAIDMLFATQSYDQIKNGLEGCGLLFKQNYNHPQRRAVIEEKVRTFAQSVPMFIQIEVFAQLARFAIEQNDIPTAKTWIESAQQLIDSCQWTADSRIPREAILIKLRAGIQDTDNARKAADALGQLYDKESLNVLSIDRADTIRPLAEAYMSIGDSETAGRVYALTIKDGAVNPNARPRAEDLSLTCLSMALNGFEPDAALWESIDRIRQGLKEPW